MEEKCENCRYWLRTLPGPGRCRRYPPQDGDERIASGYWCGEWAPKAPPKSNQDTQVFNLGH
jgi:hypothetical protein